MNLRTRIHLSALLLALFALLIGSTLWISWGQVDRARQAAATADGIQSAVVDTFILTQEYLRYDSARAVAQLQAKHVILVKLLGAALFPEPEERALLASLQKSHADLDQLVALLLQSKPEFREQIGSALLVKIQDMRSKSRQLAQIQYAKVVAIQRQADNQIIVALAVLTLFSVIAQVVVSRRLLQGVDRLGEGIRIVENGNLNHSVPVSGADELDALARSFNKMTRRLHESTTSIERLQQEVNERERAEAEVHLLNASLEQRVAERTTELTAANRELDSFAYAVSHDLRAPLRAMSGFSQALSEDYGSQLQGDAKVYLEQIDLASHKMSELIDGLLVLSRSTRGELQYDTMDLAALSQRLLAELAQGDPERRVKVQVEAGLHTHGDARMIEVVLRNLLGNAWKYSAHVAVPAAAEIRVYREERDGQIFFCVADNGAGFDMAHANRLFQPFQRLHRQDEFPGIGIGLATVQRIVHRHGGVIEARGEPGKGAVFCFSLPGVSADTAPIEKETSR
jgi:signal transduction histidine kinase